MQIKKIFIFAITFTVTTWVSYSQIIVDDHVMRFKMAEAPIGNLKVSNTSTTTPFTVKTKIIKVINPGLSTEIREESNDILVQPPLFKLSPQKDRNIKIFVNPNKKTTTEQVYRVQFIPVMADDVKQENKTDAIYSKVKVIIGTGVLILVEPNKIDKNVEWSRTQTGITFHNKGNTSVIFYSKEFCDIDKNCGKLPGKRIYPDEKWQITLPKKLQLSDIEYNLSAGETLEKVLIPYVY